MARNKYWNIAILVIIATALFAGCSKKDEGPSGPTLALNNCTSCHMDADELVATAEPVEDPGGENPGEG